MALVKVYGLPAGIAILLHAFVALFLLTGFGLFSLNQQEELISPMVMQARLVVRERKPKPTQVFPEALEPLATTEPGTDDQDLGDDQGLSQEDLDRMQRFEELQRSMLEDEITSEIRELEAAVIDEEVSLYVRGIYTNVVENWSRPPSATNEMEARLLVELYPNGDLISVGIVKSSGSDVFDRSAVAAVKKAVPFEVPNDSELYNKRFRSFYLLFKPTDLVK